MWIYGNSFCCLTKTIPKSKGTEKAFFFFLIKQTYNSTVQFSWKKNRLLTLLKKTPTQFFRIIEHSCYSFTSLSFASQKGGDSSEYDSKVCIEVCKKITFVQI